MKVPGYNAHAATRALVEHLSRQYGSLVFISHTYPNGHHIIKRDKIKYYVIYKRDFFQKFPKLFEDFCMQHEDFAGEGESINKEVLENILSRGYELIIFIHPEQVFAIYPLLVKKFCENHGLLREQIRLNTVRVPDGAGSRATISEVTYSFPKKLLQPLEDFLTRGDNDATKD